MPHNHADSHHFRQYAGAVVVVAAGNSNSDVSGEDPANCNGVIAVAATNKSGSLASYSNHGSLIKISTRGVILLVVSSPRSIPVRPVP